MVNDLTIGLNFDFNKAESILKWQCLEDAISKTIEWAAATAAARAEAVILAQIAACSSGK